MRRFFAPLLVLLVPFTLAVAIAAETAAPPGALEQAAATTSASATALPDRVMGKADAPVTLLEYASLTCSHCGHFANELLPKLDEKYIKTGKVKLIYRDFPLDALSLHAAQLAQCMPDERYFAFVKTLFASQTGWLSSADPEATLKQYAKLAGMPDDRIAACLADKSLEAALVKRRTEAEKKHEIHATPTFIVMDGIAEKEKIEGATTVEAFEKTLDKYVK